MYEARKICNFLIAQNHAHRFDLTNLRLNKLLYFIHGWGLTSRRDGFVRNHFMAWKLGPVIRPVYDTFQCYGDTKITKPATFLDYISGENRPVPYNDIAPADAEIITRIFHSYDQYTTGHLVEMSHVSGGPWDVVYSAWSKNNKLDLRISNQLIRAHFLQQAGGQVRN